MRVAPINKLKRVNTVLAGVDLNKNRELVAKLLACRQAPGLSPDIWRNQEAGRGH